MGQWNPKFLRVVTDRNNFFKTSDMGFIQIPVIYLTNKSVVFSVRIHDDCDI